MVKGINWPEQLNKIQAKSTTARLKVLLTLEQANKPISAELIISKTKLDKATVYRVLSFLENKAIVRLIDLRQGKRLYEISNNSHHHHIICTKCAKIEVIDLCLFSNISTKVLKGSGFAKITDHSMEFFGQCEACSLEKYL